MEFIAGLILLSGIGIIKAIVSCFTHPVDYHSVLPWIRTAYGSIYILGHHPMVKYWEYFFRKKCGYDNIIVFNDVRNLMECFRANSLDRWEYGWTCFEDGSGYAGLNMEEKHILNSLSEAEESKMQMMIDKKKW